MRARAGCAPAVHSWQGYQLKQGEIAQGWTRGSRERGCSPLSASPPASLSIAAMIAVVSVHVKEAPSHVAVLPMTGNIKLEEMRKVSSMEQLLTPTLCKQSTEHKCIMLRHTDRLEDTDSRPLTRDRKALSYHRVECTNQCCKQRDSQPDAAAEACPWMLLLLAHNTQLRHRYCFVNSCEGLEGGKDSSSMGSLLRNIITTFGAYGCCRQRETGYRVLLRGTNTNRTASDSLPEFLSLDKRKNTPLFLRTFYLNSELAVRCPIPHTKPVIQPMDLRPHNHKRIRFTGPCSPCSTGIAMCKAVTGSQVTTLPQEVILLLI
ncbi:hypothetical protein Anapl_11229 [Anas platyrhynchos]|uniref:Uncharacterized protein n=1 Tax=Anas platyrhynchos TaxID=8839 RepID=R0L8B5_ANAPL|nr:hypothetical protein Anapl_11229 [Anas platyrhynchos]